MSLSGKLGFVPIDEVLRLLTRSKQQGSVDVTGNGLYGRIFVGSGGIDLATIWDERDLHRHLVNSGFAEEADLRRIPSGETTLAAIADSNQAMVELIREMTVESLYQIENRGDEFTVSEGANTAYASPKTFDLEELIADAEEREREWGKVTEVVPDLRSSVQFRRDLGGREEVTIKVDDWKVLSEIGVGASVSEIAEHLGTTEFWTAKVAARLAKNELIVLGGENAVADHDESGYVEPIWDEGHDQDQDALATEEVEVDEQDVAEAIESDEVALESDADVSDEVEEIAAFEAVEASDDSGEADHNESWWQEPEDEGGDVEDADQTPEVVGEGLSEMPSVGGDNDVEEDTEAFLEKVFSELESSETDASEEGHGLLRRRRMGTLRDFSSDS